MHHVICRFGESPKEKYPKSSGLTSSFLKLTLKIVSIPMVPKSISNLFNLPVIYPKSMSNHFSLEPICLSQELPEHTFAQGSEVLELLAVVVVAVDTKPGRTHLPTHKTYEYHKKQNKVPPTLAGVGLNLDSVGGMDDISKSIKITISILWLYKPTHNLGGHHFAVIQSADHKYL